MPARVRVNLASTQELLELPGLGPSEAELIVKFRAEHGPITDVDQLTRLLSGHPIAGALEERVDFSPSDGTAPEAPGA